MLRLIDFLKKDWEGQNLDLDRAEKWFAKRTPRLDTILEPYPNTIKKMWFEEIFTLREAAVSMITKVQEVEDNDTREALSDIWYRYHRETILGLVKICREETPKFRENPYVPEWFHIVLANELDRAFWNWTENKVGAFVTCSMPSQHPIQDSCPVYTTEGWKNHGDLKVGDCVYGRKGTPKKVIQIHGKLQMDYEIEFSNGEVIQTGGKHDWIVETKAGKEYKINTETLLSSGLDYSDGRYKFYLPFIASPEGIEQELPISPYLLGMWLGDGKQDAGTITHPLSKMDYTELSLTHKVRHAHPQNYSEREPVYNFYFENLTADLRKENLLQNKHIPQKYFSATKDKRLELLAGLLDSDGYSYLDTRYNTKRQVFSNSDKQLVEDVKKLLGTLGIKYAVHEISTEYANGIKAKGKGLPIFSTKPHYQISFTVDAIELELPTVRLACSSVKNKKPPRKRISIVAIRKITNGEQGNCISVEGGEYCIGNNLILTSNSKSTIYAGGFVPLILGNCPHAQGILATYSENYAASVLKKDFAPTVYTDAYQKLFGKILKRHFNAKEKKRLSQEGLPLPIENSDKIGTIEGGILKGGGLPQITGNPAEFLLVDDPIKNREQADSPVEMKKLREEFFSSAMSRITSTTLVSVIHTRWTSDDIIGTLDDQQNMFTEEEKKDLPTYSHICFRARFDPTDEFEYDFRTYKNQDLYPSRFKAQYIRIFKGSDVTAQALLQQRPIDGHNSLIKREWINLDKHHLFPEKYAKVIISVDTSCNDGKDSDKMAVGVFGVSSSGHYYLLHLLYDRVTFTKALQGIEDVVKQYPNYNALLIETKSNGHGIYDILEKKYPNVVEAVSNDSKKARVHSTVPVLQGRKVHLPEGEVGSEYLEQLVKFKGQGKHEKDDLVDILTQTIIYCDALFREFGELSDIIPAKNMNKLKERSMWSKLQGDKKTFDKPSLALKHQHGKIFRF